MNEEIIAKPKNGESKELIDRTDDIIATAERRIERISKIKMYALKSTNHEDWVDMQGKPYLTSSGAEKVARLFGVKIRDVKTEKKDSSDEKGKFYYYLVTGVAELKGGDDYIEAVGTCSSKDQFFAKRGGQFKPLSEVEETNILKAAYSNFIGNAITRLLGIRNLTWEELKTIGIAPDKVARVEYKNGQTDFSLITEPQRKRLYAIGKSSGISEPDFKAWLKEKYSITTTKEIKKSDYDDICNYLESYRIEQGA